MCTPAVRQLVADSGVHVCYRVLREGARLAPSVKPYDEDYSTLRSMLQEARETGKGRISVAQYQRALGAGPGLQDLLAPSADTSLAAYLASLPPQERDKELRDVVEKNAENYEAVKRVMDDKRRREREMRGPECGGSKPDKGQALSRDLVRLRDQAVACMNRYPRAVASNDAQQAACEEALGTLEVLATWIRVKVGDHKSTAGRERAEARDLVAV